MTAFGLVCKYSINMSHFVAVSVVGFNFSDAISSKAGIIQGSTARP